MKRDAASTIFRTVVIAGAMLGAPACGSKQKAATTPTNASAPKGGDPAMKAAPDKKPDAATEADPCAGGEHSGGERPRGTDDEGGGAGRGFILS
jgi:hypothetical protein